MDRESSDEDTGVGPGIFVAVVGPSGAGKDTIIRAAQTLVAVESRILFPPRLVTRRPGMDENNNYISNKEFAGLVASGEFALAWRAHGLDYAVPASVDNDVRAGALVVLNISRAVVSAARHRYRNMRCVYIDASPAIRMARLSSRGREAADDLKLRMDRAVEGCDRESADFVIVNDGAIEESALRFANYCQALLREFVPA